MCGIVAIFMGAAVRPYSDGLVCVEEEPRLRLGRKSYQIRESNQHGFAKRIVIFTWLHSIKFHLPNMKAQIN